MDAGREEPLYSLLLRGVSTVEWFQGYTPPGTLTASNTARHPHCFHYCQAPSLLLQVLRGSSLPVPSHQQHASEIQLPPGYSSLTLQPSQTAQDPQTWLEQAAFVVPEASRVLPYQLVQFQMLPAAQLNEHSAAEEALAVAQAALAEASGDADATAAAQAALDGAIARAEEVARTAASGSRVRSVLEVQPELLVDLLESQLPSEQGVAEVSQLCSKWDGSSRSHSCESVWTFSHLATT